MNHAARVLACRSAPLTVASCDQLREAFRSIGGGLREDGVLDSLERFEAALDPVQKLIVFLVVAADLLRDAQHPLRGEVERQWLRLREGLEGVEAAVVLRDFSAAADLLDAVVIPVLGEIGEVGGRVALALRPRLAA